VNRAWIIDSIADERRGLADLFESLTPVQLASPSLCEGWSVKHVAAHVTTLFNVSMPRMAFRILGEQLSAARAIDQLTQQMATRPIEGIVAQLRDFADDRRHPPGRPLAPLADLVIHGEDVRRPLGIRRTVPLDRVKAAMGFVCGGRTVGFLPSSRIRGLRFVATDADASWGQGGAVIHGPTLSLLLAVMGRRDALGDLGGAVHLLIDRLDGKRDTDEPRERGKRRP